MEKLGGDMTFDRLLKEQVDEIVESAMEKPNGEGPWYYFDANCTNKFGPFVTSEEADAFTALPWECADRTNLPNCCKLHSGKRMTQPIEKVEVSHDGVCWINITGIEHSVDTFEYRFVRRNGAVVASAPTPIRERLSAVYDMVTAGMDREVFIAMMLPTYEKMQAQGSDTIAATQRVLVTTPGYNGTVDLGADDPPATCGRLTDGDYPCQLPPGHQPSPCRIVK